MSKDVIRVDFTNWELVIFESHHLFLPRSSFLFVFVLDAALVLIKVCHKWGLHTSIAALYSLLHLLVSLWILSECRKNPQSSHSREEGGNIFPLKPPACALTEVFDAVMKSDGCGAQGGLCLRGRWSETDSSGEAELHGNVLTREGFPPQHHRQPHPVAENNRKNHVGTTFSRWTDDFSVLRHNNMKMSWNCLFKNPQVFWKPSIMKYVVWIYEKSFGAAAVRWDVPGNRSKPYFVGKEKNNPFH